MTDVQPDKPLASKDPSDEKVVEEVSEKCWRVYKVMGIDLIVHHRSLTRSIAKRLIK